MKYKFLGLLLILIALFLMFPKSEVIEKKIEEKEEIRGVFFSYIELKSYFNGKSREEGKRNIQTIIETMKKHHFNLLILQVRTFSDAIYPSRIFPSSKVVVKKEGDPLPLDYLDYFIKIAHQEQIEVHAWVNPYRISSSTDTSLISTKNPAYSYLGTSHVSVIPEKGIYYNPASEDVKKIVVDGVEELVENYDIDGIHFDDYFYPNKEIDLVSYEESGTKEPLYTYRLNHVSDLVQRVYQVVHKKNNCIFGISPQGNIENNYESQFADVKRWATKTGYVDYLMPQVYYGFYNETKPYYKTIQEWNQLIGDSKVKLYFTLALYKTGTIDAFAKSGANEWLEESDILKKEVLLARNLKNYQGFSLFRYDYLVNEELQVENTVKEIKNLKEILN